MALITYGAGIIANPNIGKVIVSNDELPPWLGRCNPKNNINSLIDISGAGSTFGITPETGTIVTFDSEGAFVTRTRGIVTNILAPDNVSIYAAYKLGDLTYANIAAWPFNDGSQSTYAGYGTALYELAPRASVAAQYATGYIYYDANSGNGRYTLQNSEAAANVMLGDWVFRMLSIDAANYAITLYTGYKDKLYKTVTQSARDLTLRNKTQPIRFGFAPNSASIPGATSSLRMAECGVLDGACNDKQAAKIFTEVRALQAPFGITF
ncbi:hypothetical protein [Sodalis sp. RH18]|uniref:hypothetical protein n=1 Tax=Sodalis sp. RH18 TaxID=3394333 RepID=UPI0039B565B3